MRRLLSITGQAVATVLGAGFSPVAPGTAGSLVSAAVFWFTGPGSTAARFLLVPVVIIGYWGCTVGRREWGTDPSRVVADEFAGCWLACLAVPARWGIPGVAAAFALFRLFDILKPWPVSFFDRQDTPLGILMDDLAAGLLAVLIIVAANAVHGLL
ncbi:MAG: hypothetical protein AVO35_00880 [Candidatus Aegiribacteria sp. MLS_C]|nr:MAG: hypothetical protein AVO35_00880 [Candidatus Aegiribacteria sp. MLS_C]